MDEDTRRWVGRRVWIMDMQGKRHHGTLWWIDGITVKVRIDTPSPELLAVAARGERWDFISRAKRR